MALLLAAIIQAFNGIKNKKAFTEGQGKVGFYLMMAAHIQLILGLYLYMVNGWLGLSFADAMGDAVRRFWKVEHLAGMIIAIALITIGRIRSKKINEDRKNHKNSLIFYGISLLIILLSIPWDSVDRLY